MERREPEHTRTHTHGCTCVCVCVWRLDRVKSKTKQIATTTKTTTQKRHQTILLQLQPARYKVGNTFLHTPRAACFQRCERRFSKIFN